MASTDPSSTRLAQQVKEVEQERSNLQLRQATITSVDGAGECTINLEGDDIPEVMALSSYPPVAGDTVWVLQDIPDYLIVGKVGAADAGGGDGGLAALDSHETNTTSTDFQTVVNFSGSGSVAGGVVTPTGTAGQLRMTVDGGTAETYDIDSNFVMAVPPVNFSSSILVEIRATSSFADPVNGQVWLRT